MYIYICIYIYINIYKPEQKVVLQKKAQKCDEKTGGQRQRQVQ
jgi:hypothetical protein